jgi:hypothetical protein
MTNGLFEKKNFVVSLNGLGAEKKWFAVNRQSILILSREYDVIGCHVLDARQSPACSDVSRRDFC